MYIICFYILIFPLYFRSGVAQTITDFFPKVDGNLTKITWAHAVNSKMKLSAALESDVMMLEADVSYGKLHLFDKLLPIMTHSPLRRSDLSLEDFLTTVSNFNKNSSNLNRKGIKLDFKSIDAFLKSVDLMESFYETVDYPFWLNADIVRESRIPFPSPVDPDKFLSNAKTFNHSLTVLSLGWTTGISSIFNSYRYSHIDKMVKTIQRNNVEQDITFAVRAALAARSRPQINSLRKKVKNCTITIWSSTIDKVNIPELRNLIFDFGLNRVYIDVPADLLNSLNLEKNPKES